MNRRAVIVVIAVLGTVAVASGLWGVIAGPAGAPGGSPAVASVDSEYRFVNVFWLAAGLVVYWSLRRPAERALVARTVLSIAACGGVARLVSVFVVGWPHPVFVATMALELVVVPLVIWWHARVIPPVSRKI